MSWDSKWDLRFLELARQVSRWSKDPSTQVGAVLVKSGKVTGLGFNGLPAGVEDDPERYAVREIKLQMIVHAEVNAILQAGDRARGSTLYVYPSFSSPPCCARCAGIAIQSGVAKIVGYEPRQGSFGRASRWGEECSRANQMLGEAQVPTLLYEEEREYRRRP